MHVNTRPTSERYPAGVGGILKTYEGEAMTITVYHSPASSEGYNGERHYFPASYAVYANDAAGNVVRFFSCAEPGRHWRKFLAGIEAVAPALAANGLGGLA